MRPVFPPSKSTTRSTGCRREAAGRLDETGAGILPVHPESTAPNHARCEARKLPGSHRRVLPRRRARLAINSARCCFSCRRRSKKISHGSTPSSTRFHPKRRRPFEFRHPSWFDADVFARLKERGKALCVADSEKLETPLEVTADFGYFRLRDEGYQPNDIEEWAGKIGALRDRSRDIYVYFKHEEQGLGPEFARQLMTHLGLPVGAHQSTFDADATAQRIHETKVSLRLGAPVSMRHCLLTNSTISRSAQYPS